MTRRVAVIVAVVVAMLGGTVSTSGAAGRASPIRIGVMLPLTGPDAADYRAPLEWATENVNAAGGINGHPLQLVFRDIARQPVRTVASRLASDPSIVAAIGPANSEDARRVVSTFIEAGKVIITPSATSADLFRAFADVRPHYFWRPVESDIAQVRSLLSLAVNGGATSVALVTGDGAYGNTFYDWFGFLATEFGLRVSSTNRYNQSSGACEPYIDAALDSHPDVLLAVPDHAAAATCMAKEWRARGTTTRLLLSDAAQRASVIQSLGAAASGLEGVGLAPDPSNGFTQGFQARFGRGPSPYAANTYDALLLVAYGLEQAHGRGGRSLADGITRIVSGTAGTTTWDRPGVAQTLAAIRAGHPPAVTGAVGPWTFDQQSGVELTASTYDHWRVDGDRFTVVEALSTRDSPTAQQAVSQFKTPAGPGKGTNTISGSYQPAPKTGTWALLVAASSGWTNYRHQADVLAQYQRLRANGVPANHIIVVMANDLARNSNNNHAGTVPYSVRGPDVYRGVHIDYPLRGMTSERLLDILTGEQSADTPTVLHSKAGDDVYFYVAGHGNQAGVYLGLGDAVPSPNAKFSIVTPDALDQAIETMAAKHAYRRILVAVEACEAGSLGVALHAPGALLLAAANPVENSLSTNYDSDQLTWLADQFSYALWTAETKATTVSLHDLYGRLYLAVKGSHVSAYGPEFGNPATVSLAEFVTP